MRREAPAILLLTLALAACSSSDPPPEEPDDPAPEETCAKEATHNHPSLMDYSANLELTGEKGVKVTLVSSDPAPPAVGDNVWILAVTRNGATEDDVSLNVLPRMPDHNHPTTVQPIVTNEGSGTFRVEPVHFQMSGFWDTRIDIIDVETGDVTDTVRFGFCME